MLAVGMPRLLSKIVNLYTRPLHGVHFNTGHWMASEFSEAFQWRSIQDRANQLRRTPLLGTWVHKPSSDMHWGSWGGIMAGEPSCRSRARERRPSMYAVRRHPLITFFVLTYAISWVGLPLYAAGVWPIPFLATGPLIAALIVIPLTQGRAGLRELGLRMIRWRVRWYWYVLAVGLPLAVFLVDGTLNVALGAPGLSLAQLTPLSGVIVVFAVRLINPLDGPIGEEPGRS